MNAPRERGSSRLANEVRSETADLMAVEHVDHAKLLDGCVAESTKGVGSKNSAEAETRQMSGVAGATDHQSRPGRKS